MEVAGKRRKKGHSAVNAFLLYLYHKKPSKIK